MDKNSQEDLSEYVYDRLNYHLYYTNEFAKQKKEGNSDQIPFLTFKNQLWNAFFSLQLFV
jgi:hypothetical protein